MNRTGSCTGTGWVMGGLCVVVREMASLFSRIKDPWWIFEKYRCPKAGNAFIILVVNDWIWIVNGGGGAGWGSLRALDKNKGSLFIVISRFVNVA